MSEERARAGRGKPIAIGVAAVLLLLAGVYLGISRADGPVFVFRGGPLVSGELVAFDAVDWARLDEALGLELELVGAETSLTLWFSVTDGRMYVSCGLDCEGGMLTRWPVEVARDDRVVVRIGGRRIEGRLSLVPHDSGEYVAARAGRRAKYDGGTGARVSAESAAHDAVIDVGEALTGRADSDEPGDRLFRFDPR